MCPICKHKSVKELVRVPAYQYCPFCHTTWPKKPPRATYEEEYFNLASTTARFLFIPLFNLFYLIRRLYVDENPKRVWIDVGAGGGEFLATVTAEQKIGVEVSRTGLSSMKEKGLETMIDNVFLQSKNLNADVISFWHVLEHVGKPWQFLTAARRNLAKKGKIVIGVPNIDSLEFKLFGKHWFHLVPEYHLWHFSPKSIALLLSKNGFQIDSADYWAPEHHLTGVIQSFINKTAGSRNVLHRAVKRSTGLKKVKTKDLLWIFFWATAGLPIVVMFWIAASLLKKSGSIVIVASRHEE